MNLTITEIAQRLDGRVEGQGEIAVMGLAGIREAQPGQLTFISNPRYAAAAATTKASGVIVSEDWSRPCSATLIRVKNPEKAFSEVALWFAPPAIVFKPGIHPSAIVAPDAQLGDDVYIGPYCVIEPGVKIGQRCVLIAGCYIGHGTVIGDDCKCYPQVTIREYAQIGDRTIIHNGSVIGSDGFGYTQEGTSRKKIPQIGIVVIGHDVEIGANVTIDRARFGQTRIGNGVKIDNLVQIAHNVIIGDNSVVIAQVGISGSSSVGARTILAGQVGIAGHLSIGSDVIIGAQAGITKDVPSNAFMLGSPAYPYDKAAKIFAHIARLPELKAKIATLEERLVKLEQQLSSQ